MTRPHEEWLRERASAGAATPEQVERLIRRVEGTLAHDAAPRQAGWVSTLHAELASLLTLPGHQRAVALLAATLLLGLVTYAGLSLRGSSLEQPLESAQATTLAPTPELALVYQGSGAIAGSRQSPRIRWREGTLRLSLEPGAGVDLQVVFLETPFPDGPFGARCLAEHGVVAVPPAVANAVRRATGRHVDSLPVSAESILLASPPHGEAGVPTGS